MSEPNPAGRPEFIGERWVVDEIVDDRVTLLVARGNRGRLFSRLAHLSDHIADRSPGALRELRADIRRAEDVFEDSWGEEERYVAPAGPLGRLLGQRSDLLGSQDVSELREGSCFYVLTVRDGETGDGPFPVLTNRDALSRWLEANPPFAANGPSDAVIPSEAGWEVILRRYGFVPFIFDVSEAALSAAAAGLDLLIRESETRRG